MNSKILAKTMIVTLVLNLTGCAAVAVGGATTVAAVTDNRGIKTVISDQNLEHNINTVLDKQVPDGSFTIASYNHQVLLAGQVASITEKNRAKIAVQNTNGVKNIWNYLTIGKIETLTDITNDTYLTSLAKTRLVAQKQVNANNIKVVTCEGVVYLLGKDAGKSVQINSAIEGIRQIDGVKSVVNLIQK